MYDGIKASLLKIKYDKKLIVDPFAASTFIVDKNDSKFKFAKASANMFLFSENGTVKDAYIDEPMFLVTSYPFDKTMTKEIILEKSIDGLLQQGFIKKEIKNTRKESINGYDTIQAECYFEHQSKTKLALMTVMIKNDVALVSFGSAESKFEENINEFKKIIRKLKIK